MQQYIMNLATLKELELALFRYLQQIFKEVLENILKHIDNDIAGHRDKKRFELKEKREAKMELAATGPSYRHAVHQLEQFLGYSVMSHESLRQRLLAASVGSAKEKRSTPNVLFIELGRMRGLSDGQR